jgi:hypothetical protein
MNNPDVAGINLLLTELSDDFLIDRAFASLDGRNNLLTCHFFAEHFGTYKLTLSTETLQRLGIQSVANLATELMERLATECASDGMFKAKHRPVQIPDGVIIDFAPAKGFDLKAFQR